MAPWRLGMRNCDCACLQGIDVLLVAYLNAFSAADDVVLIIHSAYGDDFMLNQIYQIQARALPLDHLPAGGPLATQTPEDGRSGCSAGGPPWCCDNHMSVDSTISASAP